MNLNTYKEMTNKLDGFYRSNNKTYEEDYILFVWSQCIIGQSWNVVSDWTNEEFPNKDKLRRLIKRNGKLFQEKFDINTASLEQTTKHLFAAAYINAFSQGFSEGYKDCFEKLRA